MVKAVLLPALLVALASAGAGIGLSAAAPPASVNETFAISLPPAPPTDDAGATRIAQRGDDGLFYVRAEVNGAPVRFIVDTGSNIVVLTPHDAARAGIGATRNSATALRTVGGSAPMRRHTLARLRIAGQSLTEVDAATVEDGLAVSLLGQSALSRLHSVRLSGDRLRLN